MTLADQPVPGKRWPVHAILGLIALAFVLLAALGYRRIDEELTDAALSRRAAISELGDVC